MLLSILALSVAQPQDHTQIECLAKNIYHEARGQSDKGKIAVANVVINRTNHESFPKTPCKVIYQKGRGICQFSWVCSKKKIKELQLYEKCKEIARKVYYGEYKDVTNGSLYFERKRSKRGLIIGDHVFRK